MYQQLITEVGLQYCGAMDDNAMSCTAFSQQDSSPYNWETMNRPYKCNVMYVTEICMAHLTSQCHTKVLT